MYKKFVALIAIIMLTIVNAIPIQALAAVPNTFTVADYKPFYVYTNPQMYPQGAAYGAAGFAISLDGINAEVESLRSVKLTYNSCTWETIFGCVTWLNDLEITILADDYMGLYHTSEQDSSLHLVGPMEELLAYKSNIPAYSANYAISDSTTRTALSAYEYYFILDGEWVVTEVVMIQITYINAATQEEEESVCIENCGVGGTEELAPDLSSIVDFIDWINSTDLSKIVGLFMILAVLMVIGIVFMVLQPLIGATKILGQFFLFLLKVPGYLFKMLVAVLKFLIRLPLNIYQVLVTVFVAARSIVLTLWKIVTVMYRVISIIVINTWKVLAYVVQAPFKLLAWIAAPFMKSSKRSKYAG